MAKTAALGSNVSVLSKMARSVLPVFAMTKVPGMASSIWTACSRMAMRHVQGSFVPQQGHVPWMRQAKGRETRRAHQRLVAVSGLATTEWKSLWRGSSPCKQVERGDPRLWHWPGTSWHRQKHEGCLKHVSASWKTRCRRRRRR